MTQFDARAMAEEIIANSHGTRFSHGEFFTVLIADLLRDKITNALTQAHIAGFAKAMVEVDQHLVQHHGWVNGQFQRCIQAELDALGNTSDGGGE